MYNLKFPSIVLRLRPKPPSRTRGEGGCPFCGPLPFQLYRSQKCGQRRALVASHGAAASKRQRRISHADGERIAVCFDFVSLHLTLSLLALVPIVPWQTKPLRPRAFSRARAACLLACYTTCLKSLFFCLFSVSFPNSFEKNHVSKRVSFPIRSE
jgi:hypothetical protein